MLTGVLALVPSRLLQRYADYKVGATALEKRAYHTDETVLLTFDDYGSADQVGRLLAVLAAHQTRAMFFLQGDWAEKNPQLLRDIAAAGHVIGNHTYSHRDLDSLSDAEVLDEIRKGPASKWLRPPRGRYDKRIRRLADSLGYRICYWDVDSDDWQGVSAEAMTKKVVSLARPGSVVLMHVHGQHTIQALPGIIAGIRAKGLATWGSPEVKP